MAGDCCKCLGIFFLSIVLIGGITGLISWLAIQPKDFKYHITEAALVQFDLNTTTNTLYYDLSLNLTIRNPNKYITTDYISLLDARAFYEDQWFAAVKLPRFHQGTKNTTVLSIVFQGHHMVVLQDSWQLQAYYSDKASGIYNVVMRLNYREKLYLRGDPKDEFDTKIVCRLKVPLDSPSTSSRASNATFQTTKCRY